MDKRFWAIIGVIAAVFVGILWYGGNKNNSQGNGGSGSNGSSDSATVSNHVTGNPNAKVQLVDYGDFQCYYCGQYYPTVEQVIEKYKDQISFRFYHYPLTQNHPNAFAASRAAEAASMQDKFWEMFRLLYGNQASWENSKNPQAIFEGYAKQLGLNVDQYKKDYSSSKVNSIINADVAHFNKLDLQKATPTFILDGKQIRPDNSVEAFSKLIDEALKKQGQ